MIWTPEEVDDGGFIAQRPSSPLSPIPAPASQYARVATAGLHARYSVDANADEVLIKAELIEIDDDDEEVFRLANSGDRRTNFIIDASVISNENTSQVIENMKIHADQIFSVRLQRPKNLSLISLTQFTSTVCTTGLFKYLVEIDFSYLPMPGSSLMALCALLNPSVSGYCPVKRLILVRCSLLLRGVNCLMEAAMQNNFLEELILTGNRATDEAVPSIVKFLSFNLNRIRVIGLGDNGFTSNGINLLSPVLESHKYLRCLLLNGNSIGDTGADYLFRAIRDKGLLDTLNLSNCGISSCVWASRMRVMTKLSTLGLGHNRIDDDGLQRLLSGVISSISVRNLDLSNNVFGGRMSIVLGRLLQQNQLLMSLNLSALKLSEDVWEAIGSGLTQNKTLLFLDISFCEMSLKSAETICKALESNDSCTVDMRQNPLPRIMIEDPRLYHKNKEDESDVVVDNTDSDKRRTMRSTRKSPTKPPAPASEKTSRSSSHSEKGAGGGRASSESGTMVINAAPEAYKSDFSHLGGLRADLTSINPKPLDPEAAGKSLQLGHAWRTARVEEIETSKQALEILVEVREKEHQKMKEDQHRRFEETRQQIREQGLKEQLAATPFDVVRQGGNDEDMISVLSNTETIRSYQRAEAAAAGQARYTTLTSCGLIATGEIMAEDEDDPRGTFRGVAAAAGLSSGLDGYDDYSTSGTVNISIEAAKSKKLAGKAIVAEKMILNSEGGRRVLSVAYGHNLNVLGTIDVLASTTYTQARDLVRPLIERYVWKKNPNANNRRLGPGLEVDSTVVTERLTQEFVLIGLNDRKPVDVHSAKVRCLWEEALEHEDYLLLVRPGNWVALPPAEDDDED